MPKTTFTDNGEWNASMPGRSDAGYRALSYDGDLGGGTLQVWCSIEGVKVPVPDSKLSLATEDANGDPVQLIIFSAAGEIYVTLTGATAPDVAVAVA